jgi:hypothetical protein
MVAKYIAEQAAEWVISFFRHWYAGGFRSFIKAFIKLISVLDRSLAFRVNIKSLFKPMYQDRSAMGYVMGFIFRSIRIIVAFILYVFFGAVFAAAYVAWAFIPPYLFVKSLNINVHPLF